MAAAQTEGGPISCGDTHGSPGHHVRINGKSVILVGDNSTGHGCFPPSPAIEGSSVVRVNGVPLVRQGDLYADHVCDDEVHAGRVGTEVTSVNAG